MATKYPYQPEAYKLLADLFSNGESVAEVAIALGITRNVFNTWCEKYPEFDQAYQDAKNTQSYAWWMKVGRQLATGDLKGNVNAWIVNMRNKFGFKDTPTDKIEAIGTIQLNVVDKTSKDA